MNDYPLPLLGFVAYSGTGKTTLLKKLLPILKIQGFRVGIIKHAHHSFDIDHPGKDSYELRCAGASQMLVASRKRMALITEFADERNEPELKEALSSLETNELDLVLVEGFKKAAIPKIELYRPSLGNPLMYPTDSNIIAIATDTPLTNDKGPLPQLDLNQANEIIEFITESIIHSHIATKPSYQIHEGICHAD